MTVFCVVITAHVVQWLRTTAGIKKEVICPGRLTAVSVLLLATVASRLTASYVKISMSALLKDVIIVRWPSIQADMRYPVATLEAVVSSKRR